MEQAQESVVTLRGAGRSLKGTRSVINHDYVYCMDIPGGGAYAIADGDAGSCRQERASEIAVEIIRDAVRSGGYGTNPEQFLIDTAEKVHQALLEEPVEEDLEIAAALIMCCIQNGRAHIAYCGAGAAYRVEGGRIVRLTEDVAERNPGEVDPAVLREGSVPAGWKGLPFRALSTSCGVGPKSVILLCTGSVVARVGNVTIQEIAQSSATVEECADRILRAAHDRENSADVSVVVVGPSGNLREAGEYVERIKYPISALAWKYIIVGLMALTFGAAFLYRDVMDGRLAVREPVHIGETNSEKLSGGRGAGTGAETPPGKAEPSGLAHIASEPSGARVLVNGEEQGQTPIDLRLPAGVESEIRVDYRGLKPYEEKLILEDGVRIERILKLEPYGPNGGTLLVSCNPPCDRIFLDGWEVSRTARSEMTLGDVPEGKRVVEAERAGVRQSKKVNIRRGETGNVNFEIAAPRVAPAPVKPSANDSKVEVVESRPDARKKTEQPTTRKEPQMNSRRVPVTLTLPDENERPAPPQPESPDYRNEAIVVINTSSGNSNIMIFRDGALVTTGFSGARMTLEPGRYTITADGAGKNETKEVNINSGYQVIKLGP